MVLSKVLNDYPHGKRNVRSIKDRKYFILFFRVQCFSKNHINVAIAACIMLVFACGNNPACIMLVFVNFTKTALQLHFIMLCISSCSAFHRALHFIMLCISSCSAFHHALHFIMLFISSCSAFHHALHFIMLCISSCSVFHHALHFIINEML